MRAKHLPVYYFRDAKTLAKNWDYAYCAARIVSIGTDWKAYRVSVDQVEATTGFDFFSNVPPSIQNVIEAVVDNQ